MMCPRCFKSKYDKLLKESHEHKAIVCWDCLSDDMKQYYITMWFPFKPVPFSIKDIT